MQDHDQRLKNLLKEYIAEFFDLFFESWTNRLDFSRIEWLDNEVFPDPPIGKRRRLDLVAKLRTRNRGARTRRKEPKSTIGLVHVEIDSSESARALRARMHRYYTYLRERHHLPVLPVALYLRVGMEGIGTDSYEEHFGPMRILHFEYLYVGLPRLDAVEYLQRDNSLGVALSAMMKIPRDRRAWLKAEALRRLSISGEDERRKFLLGECVQAYLPLDSPGEQEEFDRLLQKEEYHEVTRMGTTWFEDGLTKGRTEGRKEGRTEGVLEGKREMLERQLRAKFGRLPARTKKTLESLDARQMDDLSAAVVTAESIDELGL